MKITFLSIVAMTLVLVSCNQKNKEADNNQETNKAETTTSASTHKEDKTGITNGIISDYLKLKNALVKDDSKASADFAKSLFNSFKDVKTDALPENLKKQFADITNDAKEHAEHIGSSEGNIEHQREHFVSLSNDINELIELLGTNQKLYLDYCPMANNNKGAVWISEAKEISNPYFGNEMSSCGSVHKEF